VEHERRLRALADRLLAAYLRHTRPDAALPRDTADELELLRSETEAILSAHGLLP
jgi:hypothetical protein